MGAGSKNGYEHEEMDVLMLLLLLLWRLHVRWNFKKSKPWNEGTIENIFVVENEMFTCKFFFILNIGTNSHRSKQPMVLYCEADVWMASWRNLMQD